MSPPRSAPAAPIRPSVRAPAPLSDSPPTVLPGDPATLSTPALRDRVVAAGKIPRHVAVIMDGNGRWAQRRGLERVRGHEAGKRAVRETVEGAVDLGVEVLTLYTFSIENWQRPRAEVATLMRLLKEVLIEERTMLRDNGVTLRVSGRVRDLPKYVQSILTVTERHLAGGRKMTLNLALSYGGRAEIVDAARAIARDVEAGRLSARAVDEREIARRLYTAGLPDPDLLIRTSGEMRLSNFLLWQLAYAELWVTDVLWPDFTRRDLFLACASYHDRERRFGRVEEPRAPTR